ncbi:AraC family transcriptional regulator [Vibrio clamense]|uniref:helix-turn-helix transcriptional regulator n=1 Tax=Vibrio clamense TaxID=2910254 RepID=UPI003D2483BC
MDNISHYSTADQDIGLIQANYHKFAFQRHYHLDFHIGLITHGQQKFIYKGNHHSVGHGQMVIMPPDELHDGHSLLDSGYQVRVFSIAPHWFSDQQDLTQNGQIVSFSELIISDPVLFSQLSNLHELLIQDNLSQLAKDCLPYDQFSIMLDRYAQIKPYPIIGLGNQTLLTLKDYLMENLDQPIRLESLSQLCQLSPSQFQRHFKCKMGIAPYAWLSRLRMEQSMKLIKSGVCGTDVAQQVGFYDQAHFTKAFKQTYGIPPSEVR